MKKIILTDADGVLVFWNKGFEEFMESKGYKIITGHEGDYQISSKYGITSHEGHLLVREFNEGPNIAHLEPFADSVKYVKNLADDGFRFIVVTSLSDDPRAKQNRVKNLTDIFGDIFDEINCIKMGSSKDKELQRWEDSGYFWIEDHMRQAEAGHEVGLRSILISQSYNSHYQTDLFPIVSNEKPWEEIYEIVSNTYR